MSITDVRAGNSQSRFNDDASSLVFTEIAIIAIAIGIGMSSWWWFGGVFLGGAVIMAIPYLNILFALAISAAWGYVAYHIGNTIGQDGANVVLCIIAILVSLSLHLSAIEWTVDMGRKD